jgi:hypothetical protein
MADKKRGAFVRGREPLRTPSGWNEQEKAFVIQLDRILDDIYRHFGNLKLKDLSPELQALILGEEDGEGT